jgi:hypothetical protein
MDILYILRAMTSTSHREVHVNSPDPSDSGTTADPDQNHESAGMELGSTPPILVSIEMISATLFEDLLASSEVS